MTFSVRDRKARKNATVNTVEIGIELSAKSSNPLYAGNGASKATTGSISGRDDSVQVSNPAIAAPEPESTESAASEPAKWVMHLDDSSSRYYWHNGETGESSWEDPSSSHPGPAEELGGLRARYVLHETGEGTPYFVPESGEGETLWILPEGAELVD